MNRKLLNLIFFLIYLSLILDHFYQFINRLGVKPELLQQNMGLLRLRNTALNSDYIILRIGITNVAGPDPKEPYRITLTDPNPKDPYWFHFAGFRIFSMDPDLRHLNLAHFPTPPFY